jgi:CBS domain-containing protein
VTGTGKSADVGQKLAGTLNSTGTRSYVLDATRAAHGDLGMVHPDDVVLVLSHSGESEEIVRLLGPLRGLAKALVFHPAGNLGRKLTRVEAVMRQDSDLRLAPESETVRQVFAKARLHGRRTGAVMLLDAGGRLSGIFTDSDLARLIEARRDAALDRPIAEVMTPDPLTVPVGTRVAEAVELLRRCKISELPVVDADEHPVGLLDITDLIGLVPLENRETQRWEARSA